MELISSVEMKIVDTNARALGISELQLMESAGRAVAEAITDKLGNVEGKEVVVLTGSGGNAGDGFVVARYLACLGARVDVLMLSKPEELRSEAAKAEFLALKQLKINLGDLRFIRDSSELPNSLRADIIVDALLGIGVKGKVREPYLTAIYTINNSQGFKVAIDVPSGLNPDTGEVLGAAVHASLTVTFHKAKPGLLKRPDIVGELVVADIGIPKEAEAFVGPGDVIYKYPKRGKYVHKGEGGSVLVVGGSETYTGAPALTAQAVLKLGADLVFVAAPERAADIIASYTPNLITIKLKGSEYLVVNHLRDIYNILRKVGSVIIGPGLGLHNDTTEAVKELIIKSCSLGKYVVIDADGLKHLSKVPDLIRKFSEYLVLTPHAGEFKLLFGTELPPPNDFLGRGEVVTRKSMEYGGVTILLKGPTDVISNGYNTRYNITGAPAMSVGGTGDVLSGLVATLLAKGLSPFDAACLAAYINGLAGALTYEELGEGMTATDLLANIPKVIKDPLGVHMSIYLK